MTATDLLEQPAVPENDAERSAFFALTSSILGLARALPIDATLTIPVSWLLSLSSGPNEQRAELPTQVSVPACTPLISIAEAATRLSVEPSWIYRRRATLPFTVRVGSRALRVDSVKLARWISGSAAR